jgi:hypothetical protein
MTAAAARRRPSSRAQLALKSESITTPAKMMMSATTNPTGPCANERGGHEPISIDGRSDDPRQRSFPNTDACDRRELCAQPLVASMRWAAMRESGICLLCIRRLLSDSNGVPGRDLLDGVAAPVCARLMFTSADR